MKTQNHDRNITIGASEIGAVMGFSEYNTPYDIFMTKLGYKESADNIHTVYGKYMEKTIGDLYTHYTGDVLEYNKDAFVKKEFYLAATPDAYSKGKNCYVEIKTRSEHLQQEDKEYEPRFQGISPSYFAQAQCQMFCTDTDQLIHITLKDKLPYTRIIARDEEFIEEMKIAAKRFWEEHIIERVPPDSTPADLSRYKPEKDVVIKAPEDIANLALLLETLDQQIKNIEKQKESYKGQLIAYMEAQGATKMDVGDYYYAFSYRSRTAVDPAILAVHPEYRVSNTSRYFVKEKKK